MQHRRPEQAVEVDDVLADEVVQLGLAAGRHVFEEVGAVALAQRLEAAEVADRRVQPDVQELAGVPGDLEAEIRSEEHTSELQSLMRISYAVFCLKKKNKTQLHKANHITTIHR